MQKELQEESINARLRHFSRDLLTWRGALADWPDGTPEGLALLSSGDAALLNCHEETSLSLNPDTAGLCVNLGSDFLEKSDAMLADASRVISWRVHDLYLKKSNMQEETSRVFDWINARVRVGDSHESTVDYHAWQFHASLVSEDRWEDVIDITLNARTGAHIVFPEFLGHADGEWRLGHTGQEANPTEPATQAKAAALAWEEAAQRSTSFVQRMDSRYQRDVTRLEEYYGSFLKEKRRPSKSLEDPEVVRAKAEEEKRAVMLELTRKLGELRERYSIRAELDVVVMAKISMRVLRIELSVQRKQATARRYVYWNPALKAFEPLSCSRCGRDMFAVAFTDDTVEPICSQCLRA
jgi:hypothetical protein